jgi:hypothetical protein
MPLTCGAGWALTRRCVTLKRRRPCVPGLVVVVLFGFPPEIGSDAFGFCSESTKAALSNSFGAYTASNLLAKSTFTAIWLVG